MARPTKSLGLYVQCCGRILRPAPWVGKVDALLMDHAGCFYEHGDPTRDQDWSLESWKTKGEPAEKPVHKVCPQCYLAIPPATKTCPDCGWTFGGDAKPLDTSATGRGMIEVTNGIPVQDVLPFAAVPKTIVRAPERLGWQAVKRAGGYHSERWKGGTWTRK